jgi:hypothetical protein
MNRTCSWLRVSLTAIALFVVMASAGSATT